MPEAGMTAFLSAADLYGFIQTFVHTRDVPNKFYGN